MCIRDRGNIRINNLWISFDSCFFNYYADDDEIQFNLAGQEGVVTIPSVISYDKVDEEDLFEDVYKRQSIYIPPL